MTILPIVLGLALGAGALMAWTGLRRLADKARAEAERRSGFWWLNGGLALMALSMIAFARFS